MIRSLFIYSVCLWIGITMASGIAEAKEGQSGLKFDGLNDYFSSAYQEKFNLTNTLTVETWLKPSTTSKIHNIVSFSNETAGDTTFWMDIRNGNQLYFGGYDTSYNPNYIVATYPFEVETWYHIAGVDTGNTYIVYVNGKEIGRQSHALLRRSPGTDYQLKIGKRGNANPHWFDGTIRELRIWNTARTAAQIDENRYEEINQNEIGLVSLWQWTPYTTKKVFDRVATQAASLQSDGFSSSSLGFRIKNKHVSFVDLAWNRLNGATYVLKRDGVEVYRGTSEGYNDTNVQGSKTYAYDLSLLSPYGESLPSTLQGITEPPYYLIFTGKEYISLPVAASSKGQSSVTIEAWVFNQNSARWFHESTGINSGESRLSINNGTTGLGIGYRETDTDTFTNFPAYTPLNINKWYHTAVVVDMPNDEIRAYINGQLIGTEHRVMTAFSNSTPKVLYLGRFNNELFVGKLSDVRIWSEARSVTDIQQNMYRSLSGSEINLRAYYKMNQLPNVSLMDYGNQNAAGTGYGWKGSQDRLSVGLSSGTLQFLSVPSSSSFGTASLTGNLQRLSIGMNNLSLTDSTGYGEGWRLFVAATPFSVLGNASRTLPSNSLKMYPPSKLWATEEAFAPTPTIAFPAPWNVDDGNQHLVVYANENEGMGRFSMSFPSDTLTLSLLPAFTYIDAVTYPSSPTLYQSTITWSLVQGP